MQKILFLCSCLEPGKDGIGDYIRKLAEYCKNVGIEIFLLAINDHYIEDNYVKYYNSCRISNKLNQKKKLLITKSIINKFQPQWISLQIMPYSLQSKGIIFNQISFFKKITLGLKIHIMFHELWIGEEKGAPIKNTLIGFLQKKSIKKFVEKLNPNIIHTSIPLNKLLLKNLGIDSKILTLFGNIKVNKDSNPNWVYSELASKIADFSIEKRNEFIVFGLFGTWYFNWNLESLLKVAVKESVFQRKKILVISIGNIGEIGDRWNVLKSKFRQIEFVTLGRQSEENISSFLSFIDYGIATTPQILLGKSGTYMAMVEHGVAVFCDINKIKFNFDTSSMIKKDPGLFIVDQNFDQLPKINLIKKIKFLMDETCNQFIEDLNSIPT